MNRPEFPITPGVRLLREKAVRFVAHQYVYEEQGGTAASARALGVDEHAVIKTLVMQTESRVAILVLMHGDREVSTKQLARLIGAKRVEPCDGATAERHTGYQFGGTSPFGTRHPLDLYVERTIFDLSRIYINGGKRGFLVEIDPKELLRIFPVTEIDVAIMP